MNPTGYWKTHNGETTWVQDRRPTAPEAKRHCRWKIEDANAKLYQNRIDQTERDRLVKAAWDRLEEILSQAPKEETFRPGSTNG